MSWLSRVNNEMVITTGDGKQYTPNWMNASLSTEYNVARFEFPEVRGTLVQRGKPRGASYRMELIFQGDDHLDVAEAFRVSAEDNRPWAISHPLYGDVIVQPLGLDFDNTRFNITEIKGIVVETITKDEPKITVDPSDKIIDDKANTDEAFAQAFVVDVPNVNTEVATDLTNQVSTIYGRASGNILNTVDAESYFNLFNEANTAILNVTSNPLAAIRAIQAFVSYPSQFQDIVKNRMDLLVSQFQSLVDSVDVLTSPAEKKTYETNAGATVSAMVLASITNAEYDSGTDVLAILDALLAAYDQYILDLDGMQTDNGGEPDSYMPNPTSLDALNALVSFGMSNLFNIALDSKQERSILVEEDTTVILLAHRLYGLLEDDSTIDKLISTNRLSLTDLLIVRKGTRIRYYV